MSLYILQKKTDEKHTVQSIEPERGSEVLEGGERRGDELEAGRVVVGILAVHHGKVILVCVPHVLTYHCRLKPGSIPNQLMIKIIIIIIDKGYDRF